jgi:glycosyltransferase involved in cell wall biosynthesis
MRILIIGDSPKVTGGVSNYTRPLFLEQKKSDIEVKYLYSASRLKADYRFFTKTKITKDPLWEEGVYKIVNSDNLDKNYDRLELDSNSQKNDQVYEKFIQDYSPDVIHINEIIGFSTNIINIAKSKNIKVIVTVHEYWWLCPKRVMVDFNRKICPGPNDLKKCTHCISLVSKGYDSSKRKKSYLIRNQFPRLYKLLSSIKQKLKKKDIQKLESLNFGKEKVPSAVNQVLKEQLSKRLNNNIQLLNRCDKIIGVSKDVKDHLVKYGVNSDIIIVQHIGSAIAEKTIIHQKKVQKNKIIIGFIGGVSYYKGVHQLVEAFISMPDEYKRKSKLEIFGNYNVNYKDSIGKNILEGETYPEKVKFYGRYVSTDIPEITNKIDIAVLPSLCADTAPQTIFESFSSQLPLIVPNVGGFPDFITHKENGLIYEASNVKSLREALMYVIDHPDKIEEMRANIPEMKTISSNTKELIKLYNEVI